MHVGVTKFTWAVHLSGMTNNSELARVVQQMSRGVLGHNSHAGHHLEGVQLGICVVLSQSGSPKVLTYRLGDPQMWTAWT